MKPVSVIVVLLAARVQAFSTLFQQAPTLQKTAPSKKEGVDIELPNFDELFDRIQRVSPLARTVMAQDNMLPDSRGFAAVDDTCTYQRFVGRSVVVDVLRSI